MSASPPNPPPRRSTSATVFLLGFVLLIALVAAVLSRRNAGPPPAEALDADGSATAEAAADHSPALAGLSGTIIFMSDRDGDWDVYTLDLASGALSNLTRNRAEDGFASYALDGEQISFLSDEGRADDAQLGGFLMNPDGSGRAQAAADLATFMSIVMNGRGDWDVRGLGTSTGMIRW
ncbi:MAG: hypothetical protein IPK19_18910 [Chloroflexi bacterium]|nr:hypothetical protein [Chloroflexota bacterium]